jgi:hypothetical protein
VWRRGALAQARLARAPAARSRLQLIAASASQAALAGKEPDGRCARGPVGPVGEDLLGLDVAAVMLLGLNGLERRDTGFGRGPVRGPGRRIIPAPRVPSVRLAALSVQLVRAQPGRVPLVMRRWPASERRLRLVLATYRCVEGYRSSLGYEPYDVGLCRRGPSLVTALASADLRYGVFPGLLRLPHLSLSRHVSCTNPCTNPFLRCSVKRLEASAVQLSSKKSSSTRLIT